MIKISIKITTNIAHIDKHKYTRGPKAGRTLLGKEKGNQFVFLNLVGCIKYSKTCE
jgi:hypothetical protein